MIKISINDGNGNWTLAVADARHVLARAVKAAVGAAATGLRDDLRQQIAVAGYKPRLGQMIGATVFPRGRDSIGAAATVYARGPQADLVLSAFAAGLTVHAKNGRYLCIPTGFNATAGWRGRGERGLRVTPAQMIGVGFLRPTKSGGYIWCLRVAEQARASGRRRRRLIAGGLAEVATGNVKGRHRWIDALLDQGFVPMFILSPVISLPHRLTPDALARAWRDRIPDLIERALPGGWR